MYIYVCGPDQERPPFHQAVRILKSSNSDTKFHLSIFLNPRGSMGRTVYVTFGINFMVFMVGKTYRTSRMGSYGILWIHVQFHSLDIFQDSCTCKWSFQGKDRIVTPIHLLVGGFNPTEKHQSNWILSPGRSENKNIWNHHLDLDAKFL